MGDCSSCDCEVPCHEMEARYEREAKLEQRAHSLCHSGIGKAEAKNVGNPSLCDGIMSGCTSVYCEVCNSEAIGIVEDHIFDLANLSEDLKERAQNASEVIVHHKAMEEGRVKNPFLMPTLSKELAEFLFADYESMQARLNLTIQSLDGA